MWPHLVAIDKEVKNAQMLFSQSVRLPGVLMRSGETAFS